MVQNMGTSRTALQPLNDLVDIGFDASKLDGGTVHLGAGHGGDGACGAVLRDPVWFQDEYKRVVDILCVECEHIRAFETLDGAISR